MYRYALEGFKDAYALDPFNYIDEAELKITARELTNYYIKREGLENAGRHIAEYAAAAQYSAYYGAIYLSINKRGKSPSEIVDDFYLELENLKRSDTKLYSTISASVMKSAAKVIDELGDNDDSWGIIHYLVLIAGLYIAKEMEDYYRKILAEREEKP